MKTESYSVSMFAFPKARIKLFYGAGPTAKAEISISSAEDGMSRRIGNGRA
jgi:hypothetical protein